MSAPAADCESCGTSDNLTMWHTGYRGHYCTTCTAYIDARETVLSIMGERGTRVDDCGTYAVDMGLDPATVTAWAHLVPVGYTNMVR